MLLWFALFILAPLPSFRQKHFVNYTLAFSLVEIIQKFTQLYNS